MSNRLLRNLQQMFRGLRQAGRNLNQTSRIWNRRREYKKVATFNKFNSVAALPWNGGCNLASDQLLVMLTNTLPVATNQVYADVSAGELSTANGYTAGGAVVTTTSSTQTAGLWKYIGSCASPTWSASGSMGPFRYVIIYDQTPTTPLLKPLLGWWDYGSNITMASGDTFTVQLDPTNGVLQMS